MAHLTEAQRAVEQLLLDLVRVDRDPASALGRARSLAPVDAVVGEARDHGVEALLGEYAVAHPEMWPELAEAERETRLQLLAWMTLTKFELGETVTKLDEAGIAHAVVKGPVLAGHAYGGLEYRAFSDVDLLIARRDLDRTLAALGASAAPAIRPGGQGQMSLTLPRNTPLDLHWELINDPAVRRDFHLDTDAVLSRRRYVDVGGLQVATLDATDTLLHVCSHAAVSGGHRLVWYVDIDRVIRRDGVNRAELAERAKATGLTLTVDALTRRCAQQLGTPSIGLAPAGAARAWRLGEATLRGVPISAAEARPHRGQIYFRSTRDTLGHSVAAAGRLVVEVARTRR